MIKLSNYGTLIHFKKFLPYVDIHMLSNQLLLVQMGRFSLVVVGIRTIKLWDVNTGAEICTLTGHQLQVNSVAFSLNGQFLASASFDRTIHLWQLREIQNRPCYALLGTLSGHTRAVLTVAFSPDGNNSGNG